MVSSLADIRSNRRIMAYTAAAIYAIAGLDGAIEGLLPNDPPFSIVPVVAVFVIFAVLMAVGPRLPRWGLGLLGPLGVGLIACAMATTPAPGDGAVLYALPVVWTAFFFGRRGAGLILACVAVGHALALLAMPPIADAYPDRWVDVMVSLCGVALVVLVLERRNELLLERLAEEARTDPLTQLLNRRGFDDHACREFAHAHRDGTSIALVMLDIDHFKQINDEWGHVVGDRVLANLAQVLTDTSRVIDVAARLGGEEFAVLMPGSDVAGAEAFIERVRDVLENPGSDLPAVRISAGVAAAVGPTDQRIMVEQVDRALYAAKRGGRDRTVVFDRHDFSLPV